MFICTGDLRSRARGHHPNPCSHNRQCRRVEIPVPHQLGCVIEAQEGAGEGSEQRGGRELWRFVRGIATSEFCYYCHTDQETPETVPSSGLEATSRTNARIIDEVSRQEPQCAAVQMVAIVASAPHPSAALPFFDILPVCVVAASCTWPR